jgi:membrane protein DedA with SNARE-associated domain
MNTTNEIIKQVGAMSYFGILGISFLANIVVPVPEEVVILAIGYVAGTGKINFWITYPIVVAGAFVSDMVMFTLSRRNNPIVKGFYDKFFSKIFPINQSFIDAHINKIIFMSRFLVQLRFLGPFLAGQAHTKWKKFIMFDLSALVIYTGVLLWAGHYFAMRIDKIFDDVNQIRNVLLILVGVVILWSLGQVLKKLFLGEYVIALKHDPEKHEKTWIPGVKRVKGK